MTTRTIRLVALLALLSLPSTVAPQARVVGASVRNPPPPLPYVERDVCPGEGCTLGRWLVCRELSVRQAPEPLAPEAFRLRPNTWVTAVAAEMRVERAGLLVFHDTVRFHDLEAPSDSGRRYTPADTLFPLFFTTEEGGYGAYWYRGQRIQEFWFGADLIGPDLPPGARLVRPSVTTWWVRIRRDGGTEGWLAMPARLDGFVGIFPHYEDPTRVARGCATSAGTRPPPRHP